MHTTTNEMLYHLIDMAQSRDLPYRTIKPVLWHDGLRWNDYDPISYSQLKYWITRAVHHFRLSEGI